MPVQRCMVETSSRDFRDWRRFKWQSMNMPNRTDYYLAQIAQEVHKGLVKNPNRVKLTEFLLKFVLTRNEDKPLTKKEITKRTNASKSFWSALLGVALNKPKE